ncbi:MAG: AAA family ATPase [Chloroflexota bacterium]|nr:AAA family ATPase [Chloroflexota bacterium]
MPRSAWLKRAAARSIVKLLALNATHRLHREQILDALWPDAELESALNSFGKALHAARHALESDPSAKDVSNYLDLSDDVLALNMDRVWIDIDHFEALSKDALGSGDVEELDAALSAYGGELLPEDRYEEWTISHREALSKRYLQVLLRQADVLERRGAYGPAVAHLQRILNDDPVREESHRGLMRIYALVGHRSEALRQYEACCEALREHVDAAPALETRQLYEDIVAGTGRGSGPDRDDLMRAEGIPLHLPAAIQRQAPTPFVGRERVLQLLSETLSQVTRGAGAVLLFSGETGVGKTRMGAEIARNAHKLGAAVLWGASYEHEGLTPYGPFVEALEGYFIGLPQSERAEAATSHSELSRLLPALSHASDVQPAYSDPLVGRSRLVASISKLLSDISTIQPLVLVLDDLHAADTESLQLLHHLARLAPERRWFIVATYRDDAMAVGSKFQQLVASVMRAGLCRRIGLGRLSAEACTDLLQNMLANGRASSDLIDALYGRSLGNPLVLQELVHAMQEQGDLTVEDGEWRLRRPDIDYVPSTFRDLVAARVDSLAEDVQRVLSLAAVAGVEFRVSQIQAAASLAFGTWLTDDSFLNALDQAVAAGILEERGRDFAFRHPMLRTVLYARLSFARRSRFHSFHARILESNMVQDIEALAYHYSRSEEQDKAILYLEKAADRARAIYANQAARTYYQDLLGRLELLHRVRPAAVIRERLGSILTIMAQYDEALDLLGQTAVTLQSLDDAEGVARVSAQIGLSHYFRGTHEEGKHFVESALRALLVNGRIPDLSDLYVSLAHLCFGRAEYQETIDASSNALRSARQTGDNRIVILAQLCLGSALTQLGRWQDARQVLAEALRTAESIGEESHLSALLNNIAVTYMLAGEHDRGREYLERGLAVAERLGDPARTAFMTYRLGVNAYIRGDREAAKQHFEKAADMGRHVPRYWASPLPLLGLALLSASAGETATAIRRLEESIAIARHGGSTTVLLGPHSLLTERELLGEHPEAAQIHLHELLARLESATDENTTLHILERTILNEARP